MWGIQDHRQHVSFFFFVNFLVFSAHTSCTAFSFKLRQYLEPNGNPQGEPKAKNDLAESLHYIPLGLEKETEEFVKSVGFLRKPFTFDRNQLAMFLQTLHDVVGGDDH